MVRGRRKFHIQTPDFSFNISAASRYAALCQHARPKWLVHSSRTSVLRPRGPCSIRGNGREYYMPANIPTARHFAPCDNIFFLFYSFIFPLPPPSLEGFFFLFTPITSLSKPLEISLDSSTAVWTCDMDQSSKKVPFHNRKTFSWQKHRSRIHWQKKSQ